MNWPTVTILLVTWNRPYEIRRTLDALGHFVRYSGPVHVHIADDGSPQGYVESIRAQYPDIRFTVTTTKRKGWGANVNTALRAVSTDYVFLCEDDYVARKRLDFDRGVALLESILEMGLIRYDGLEGHQFFLRLCEAQTRIGKVHYLWLQRDSPSAYIYSNRPHMVHRRFHEHYGYYPEGLDLGSTEVAFGIEVRTDEGPHVVALSDGVDRAFDHIGKTWRHTEHNVGKEVLFS